MAIPAGNLLDLEPLQRLDRLRCEDVAGVAVPEPPEISPAPAVHLQLVLGVGGGVVRAADDQRDPGRVEAAQHRGHEPVLRVAVPELPVLSSAPRAQHVVRWKQNTHEVIVSGRAVLDEMNAPQATRASLQRSATEWLAPAETSMTEGGGASGAAITVSISIRLLDQPAPRHSAPQTAGTERDGGEVGLGCGRGSGAGRGI